MPKADTSRDTSVGLAVSNWSLAVDFGTTNTAAAYRIDNGPSQPVRLSDQAEQMPSAILALDTGITVGHAAIRSARLDPQRFEVSPKRRLGEMEILLGPREWKTIDLIAAVLLHVKQKGMWVAGGDAPSELILTYPQEWAQWRQDLLRQAAVRAGFDSHHIRLVTEPIAAASWYAATQPVPPGKSVAVFDFGGGTCDVAVLKSSATAPGSFEVIGADGIDPLGGELLDLRLLDWTLEQLRQGDHADLAEALNEPENLAAMLTLREQVRHAKHELAEYESARIPVVVGNSQTVITVTIDEFDRLVGDEIDSAIELTRRTLASSGISPADLHTLYLTGGSSHLRLVHRKMTEMLGRPPATLNDPKLVVAQGALLVPTPNAAQAGAHQQAAHQQAGHQQAAHQQAAHQQGAHQPAGNGGSNHPVPQTSTPSHPSVPTSYPHIPMPPAVPPGASGAHARPEPSGAQQPAAYQPPGYQAAAYTTSGTPYPSSQTVRPPDNYSTGSIPRHNTGPNAPVTSLSSPIPGTQSYHNGQNQGTGPQYNSGTGTSYGPGPSGNSTGSYSTATGHTGSSGKNGPPKKWIFAGIGAALVAVMVVVIVLVTGNSDPVGPGTAINVKGEESMSSAAVPTDQTSASGIDQGVVICSDGSVADSQSDCPAATEQIQVCSDGSEVPAAEECPAEEPMDCWDGSTITSGSCPALEGRDALQWVFPVPDDWNRTCEDYVDDGTNYSPGELEVQLCSVEELPGALIYLSRWDSAASASDTFAASWGQGTSWNLEGDTESLGLYWSTTDTTSAGVKLGVEASTYTNYAYSILVYFDDPDGAGKDMTSLFNEKQQYRKSDALAWATGN